MNNKEFQAEFGNVEKVVKMPVPPTWVEFNKLGRAFYSKNKYARYTIILMDNNETISITSGWYEEHFIPNTEENYYKALDKMVELWREEV